MFWKWIFLLCLAYYGCEGFTTQRLIDPGQEKFFELSILHINDFHARFEEINNISGICHKGEECIGGVARLVTLTRELMKNQPNAILLNAGDHYQGTLWYNIHRWRAIAYFMNKLPHDAMTIGNHDFDDGVTGLVPFLKTSIAPIVVANMDVSKEPSMQGLYKNSTIITRNNQTIGVIGVISNTTHAISNTGNVIFLDEIESVNEEARKLKANDVNIIIVLSHCGLVIDKVMAANCPEVDVIVGGHSHTFHYTGKPPFIDKPVDKYPIVVKQDKTNRTVLVVQASAYTRYLGNLSVWFDRRGEVVNWEGNPILLNSSIVQDPEIMEELKPWAEAVEAFSRSVVGETKSLLNSSCQSNDCNAANFITDAMVHAYKGKAENPKHWTYAAIACMNAGGIRNSIEPGFITYGDVVTMQPFQNTWDVIEIQGEDLLSIVEESVARSYQEHRFLGANFLHWSGLKIVYNFSNPVFSRVVDLKVRCQACEKEGLFEKLRMNDWYRIVVPSFIVQGGGRISTFAKKHRNRVRGSEDVKLLIEYIQDITPFDYKLDGRLIINGEWSGGILI